MLKSFSTLVFLALLGTNALADQQYYVVQDNRDYSKDFELFKQRAMQGEPRGQFKLGEAYMLGRGVEKNLTAAEQWLEKAAEQGNTPADNLLFSCDCLTREDARSAFNRGEKYLAQQDYDHAVKMITASARKRNPEAETKLGIWYQQGFHVPQSDNFAIELFSDAVEQGDVEAQARLGEAYWKGRGVPIDLDKSRGLLLKAAERGSAFAQLLMGHIYSFPNCKPSDYKIAVKWTKMAADQGYVEAKEYLKNLIDNNTPCSEKNSAAYNNAMKARSETRDSPLNNNGYTPPPKKTYHICDSDVCYDGDETEVNRVQEQDRFRQEQERLRQEQERQQNAIFHQTWGN